MNPLALLPGWVKLAIFGAVLAGMAGLYTWRVHVERDIGRAEVQLKWDADKGRQKDAALAAVKAVRAEEDRRAAALQGVIDETHKDLAAARSAAVIAAAAGQRLRDQLAAARARGRTGTDPVTAAGSAPADATEGLLADVQRRLDEAQERVARHADESRIAGQACERAYESLTLRAAP